MSVLYNQNETLPYFYRLKNRLISDSLAETFRQIAWQNSNLFLQWKDENNSADGNFILYKEEFQSLPEIKQLKEKCSLFFYALLYMHPPNVEVVKHIDNPKHRKSTIIHPLFPIRDYTSTFFYENIDDEEPCTVCDYGQNLPVILNLNKVHNVKNNSSVRVNLQFSFKADFETLVDLYQTGKLFKE